ncbi:MAG: RagB/SusD family nutrient uptake outer membrane protein [Rikenellaceae bacterium]|nr:RagB/SusD family nutrient uptake outer membrane protein [Rikenellaceae bacterium]
MYKIMKIRNIFSLAAVTLCVAFALSGCIKETFPKTGNITEGQMLAADTEVVLEKLLPGINASMLGMCYSSDMHSDYGQFSMGIFLDYSTDWIVNMGDARYNHFNQAMWGQGYGPSGTMSYFVWWRYYPQIRKCNQIIDIAGDEESLAFYRGTAKAYRAMFYLDLARLFEPMYSDAPNIPNYNDELYSRDVIGKTVPYIDETFVHDAEKAENNPRLTREEMFTRILADLKDAEECLKDFNRANASEINLAVVYGLYARAYMWLGGFDDGLNGELPEGNAAYTLASEYAQKTIAAHGGYVMTEAEWTNVNNAFNTIVPSWILAQIYSSDTVNSNLHNHPAHFSPELIESYCALFVFPGVPNRVYDKLGNADIRKKIMKGPDTTYEQFKNYTLMSADEFEGVPPYTFFKYRPGSGNRTDNMVAAAISLPLMRLEEMYFIDMEATLHTQGVDAAWQKLMSFMSYRDSNYICPVADYDGMLEEIIFQKGVEFWAEGIIMYDMKRLGMGIKRKYTGTNFDEKSQFNTTSRVPWWNFCIPMGETDMNLGIEANNPDPSNGVTFN